MDVDQPGKYRIVAKLGQGSMGVVYKAYDPVLHRFVAIKTLSASLDREDFRLRFRREAQWIGQLNHPNLVTLYDFGEEKGRAFMAMELLEGINLKRLIELRLPLLLAQKLRILRQVCDGLAFAHSRGVVHRDLKPSNIHLQMTGQVKIMDFGLARCSSAEPSQPGLIIGTPYYMAPELLHGATADACSDVFSLGVLFYELLCYQKPFEAESLSSLLYKVADSMHRPLRDVCPELPESLYLLVERALAKDPAARFSNAGELRSALALVSGTEDAATSEHLALGEHAPTGAGVLFARPPATETALPASGEAGSGSVGTYSPSRSVFGPGRARMLQALAVILLLAAVTGGAFRWRRGPAFSREDAEKALRGEVQALRRELLENLLAEAQRELDRNDIEGALALAQRALRLDPSSQRASETEARASEILARRMEAESVDFESASRPARAKRASLKGERSRRDPAAGNEEQRTAAETARVPDRGDTGDASGRPDASSPEPVATGVAAIVTTVASSDPQAPLPERPAPSSSPAASEAPLAPFPYTEAPVRVALGSPEAIPWAKVPPDYPPVAARSRTEGAVLLEVEVDRSGSPSAVRVIRSSPLFEKAAVEAVRRWRWKPYVVQGKPVPFVLTLSVEFRLDG